MSDSQKYDRQKLIPGWDQNKLSNAKVAMIGAGALGNHVGLGLIGLGIGTIKIYDYDDIEAHNLNRQSLFCEDDVGKNKAEVLATRLKERNNSITVVGINEKIEDETIDMVIRDIDIVIDCVDLIHVRRTLSRFCLFNDIPLIHGGISWSGGEVGLLTRETPCINCIYPEFLQKKEMDEETSCINNPDPSVVYISQIIAGYMVYTIRKALMPLKTDENSLNTLLKIDFRLENPLYYENIRRNATCECVDILQTVDPGLLKKEAKVKKRVLKQDIHDLKNIL